MRGSWLLFPSWRMAYGRLTAGPWLRLGAFLPRGMPMLFKLSDPVRECRHVPRRADGVNAGRSLRRLGSAPSRRSCRESKKRRLTTATCWRTLLSAVGEDTLMLSRNQDFERAIAEFDHVFSRIPPYIASSGNHASLRQLARDGEAKAQGKLFSAALTRDEA